MKEAAVSIEKGMPLLCQKAHQEMIHNEKVNNPAIPCYPQRMEAEELAEDAFALDINRKYHDQKVKEYADRQDFSVAFRKEDIIGSEKGILQIASSNSDVVMYIPEECVILEKTGIYAAAGNFEQVAFGRIDSAEKVQFSDRDLIKNYIEKNQRTGLLGNSRVQKPETRKSARTAPVKRIG